jgi:hypothetical protein
MHFGGANETHNLLSSHLMDFFKAQWLHMNQMLTSEILIKPLVAVMEKQ